MVVVVFFLIKYSHLCFRAFYLNSVLWENNRKKKLENHILHEINVSFSSFSCIFYFGILLVDSIECVCVLSERLLIFPFGVFRSFDLTFDGNRIRIYFVKLMLLHLRCNSDRNLRDFRHSNKEILKISSIFERHTPYIWISYKQGKQHRI